MICLFDLSFEVTENLLSSAIRREIKDSDIMTLDESDFFIHLCAHLYKEATTLPWVEMKRDMTLYKYADIYLLVSEMSDSMIDRIFKRARGLDVDQECAFAILQTAELFDIENDYAIKASEKAIVDDTHIIHRVISPKDNKTFLYTEKNIFERFFADDRKALLKEEKKNEKA